MTTVSNSSNTSTITFDPEIDLFKQFTLSSHTTKYQQIVTVKIDDQKETEYRLTGDGSKPETVFLPSKAKTVVFTFSYEADGKQQTSKIRSGGPYALGELQSIMLAVENGDDVDYNDVLVQLLFK
ncbi:hypothetical protein Q7P35_011113 [Cladosporium inversicolor]